MTQGIRLADVINTALERAYRNIRVCLPGRVESYDPGQQRASIQPLINDPYVDEDGEQVADPFPVITDVPIAWPNGGGFQITLPLAKGDNVMLVFSGLSLDVWLRNGGQVSPGTDARHSLSDAIAIPCARPFARPLEGVPSSHMQLGKPDGPQINITGAIVNVGESAGDGEALVKFSEMFDLLTWLSSHTHPVPGVTTGGGSTTSAGPTTTPPVATGTTILKGK